MSARVTLESLERRELLAAVPIQPKIKVAMLTDTNGNALNSSRITVRFSENITLLDASKFRMFGYAINPASGSGTAQQKVTINLTSVTEGADGNKIVFETDRRVRKGARLFIYDGALANTSDSSPVAEQSTTLPKGLNKERYTLACRAFGPTNLSFFNSTVFAGAPAVTPTPSQPAAGTVLTNLTAFLDAKVAAGVIDAAKKQSALDTYNSANAQSIVPSANLRAAIVSLVGTVAEPSINSMLTSNNVTGKAFTVVDFSATEVSASAVVAETKNNPTTGRLRTLFKSIFQGESFQALSAIITLESLRQDVSSTTNLPDGLQEDIFVNTAATMVWAQQLLVDKTLAAAGTQLVTDLNARLLALLNSGKALFPRVGLLNAPILGGQDVFVNGVNPTDGQGAYTSFENYIRRIYAARNLADVDTAANPLARDIQNNINGTNLQTVGTFSNARLSTLDGNQQIITDRNAVTLAAILKLQVRK